MTCTCSLCSAILQGSDVLGENASQRRQRLGVEVMRHLGAAHPEFFATLVQLATGYHVSLAFKAMTSTDPEFATENETAQRFSYWMLRGRFEFPKVSTATQPIPPKTP